MSYHRLVVLASLLATAAGPWAIPSVSETATAAEAYRSGTEEWRREREARLTAEYGWLSLVGLHWLEEGRNSIGTCETCDVRWPEGTAPENAGWLVRTGDDVVLEPHERVAFTIDDEVVGRTELASDARGTPDVVRLGALAFHVIERGDRIGVRSKHPEAPARIGFAGLSWYPVDPDSKVRGSLERFERPRELAIATVAGTTETMLSPGLVRFEIGGKPVALLPLVTEADDRELFIVFRDATSGRETYGAARFLYGTLEENDTVVLDFNRAYNPPCAFTPYATCPLPPRENRLEVAIRAGERTYEVGH